MQAGSSGLGDPSSLDRSQINLEHQLVLFALLLVLLAQSDDLAKDLHIKAIALGLQEISFWPR